jgi:alpha-galactosidase
MQIRSKALLIVQRDLGIELFVLDDGWFGKRDEDISGLGDWIENTEKLKDGLQGIADYVHQKNMSFGLWFEPEMVNADSDLFREHPDYALQTPGRGMSTSRDQYVLDFSRQEVRAEITKQMRAILDTIDIDYIKWDMNRHLTEVHSSTAGARHQGEIFHRYVLGLYEMLEELTTEYDHILWEGCSGVVAGSMPVSYIICHKAGRAIIQMRLNAWIFSTVRVYSTQFPRWVPTYPPSPIIKHIAKQA